MKEKKEKTNKLKMKDIRDLKWVVMLILFVVVANICLSNITSNHGKTIKLTKEEQQLIAETPLTGYSYWSSLDRFPRYKVEAAQKVEQLMSDGVSKEEACQKVINEVSDKIYKDTVYFIENSKDIPSDDWEKAYYAYIEQTQQ